jgi:hypothetical protein
MEAIAASWNFLMTPDGDDDIDLLELGVHHHKFLETVLTSPIPVTCKLGGPMDFVLFLSVLCADATFDPDANALTISCSRGQFLLRTTRLMMAWVALKNLPRYISPMADEAIAPVNIDTSNFRAVGGCTTPLLAFSDDPMEKAVELEDAGDEDSDSEGGNSDSESQSGNEEDWTMADNDNPPPVGTDKIDAILGLEVLESSEPVQLLDVSDTNDILQ